MTQATTEGQVALDLLRRIAEALEKNNEVMDRWLRPPSITGWPVTTAFMRPPELDEKSLQMRETMDKMPAKPYKEKK